METLDVPHLPNGDAQNEGSFNNGEKVDSLVGFLHLRGLSVVFQLLEFIIII